MQPTRIVLDQSEIPTHWYNVVADMTNPPAPESCHAIRAAIDEALKCKVTGEPKAIFFNLTGHGHFDMAACDRYFAGDLKDFAYPAEAIEASLAHLPKF